MYDIKKGEIHKLVPQFTMLNLSFKHTNSFKNRNLRKWRRRMGQIHKRSKRQTTNLHTS